jgi:hypothetical protein
MGFSQPDKNWITSEGNEKTRADLVHNTDKETGMIDVQCYVTQKPV